MLYKKGLGFLSRVGFGDVDVVSLLVIVLCSGNWVVMCFLLFLIYVWVFSNSYCFVIYLEYEDLGYVFYYVYSIYFRLN